MDEENTFDWNKVSGKNEVDLSPVEVSQGTEQTEVEQTPADPNQGALPTIPSNQGALPTIPPQGDVSPTPTPTPTTTRSSGRRSRREFKEDQKAKEDREALATGQSPVPTDQMEFDPNIQSEQPSYVDPPNFEEIFKDRRNIRKLKKAGLDIDKTMKVLGAVETTERGISPFESVEYIISRAAAAGRPAPAVISSSKAVGMSPTVPLGTPTEVDAEAVPGIIIKLIKDHDGDMKKAVESGAANSSLGSAWVDWYINEISQPGLPGWLSLAQEEMLGLVPASKASTPVLDRGDVYKSNPELIEDGHVRAYDMLGQRGLVDVKAAGTKNSTMDVLRAARLMEKKGRTEEQVTAFKRENGVTALEEDTFNRLKERELDRFSELDEEGNIQPVGKRGSIDSLAQNVKEAEEALKSAKALPDTAVNRKAVQDAQEQFDSSTKKYEAVVQTQRLSPDLEGIYDEYAETMGPLALGTHDKARTKVGPVAGAVVRRGEGRAPVQGTLGGTDAAAVEDLERLAEDIVHQKTRLAEALMRKSKLAIEVGDTVKGYSNEDLMAAKTYATENFPAVRDEWLRRSAYLRTEFNRKAVVVGPVEERQREAKIEKEKAAWYKSKGYTFSKSEGTYLLTGDAKKADDRAVALKRLAERQAVATEDIKRFKEGLAAMGGSKEDAEGIK